MSAILYLPGVLLILLLRRGTLATVRGILTIVAVQIWLAVPFLKENWQGYIGRAFEFSRVFLYKWTVNWRFVSEQTFLSKQWAAGLLIGHLSVLICFAWKWCGMSGGVLSVARRALTNPAHPCSSLPLSRNGMWTCHG
jgi:alpha-1,3-mannosyltransferase